MATRPTFQLPVSGSPLAPKAKKADLESAIQDGFDILHGEIEDLENAQFTEAPTYEDTAEGLAATNDGDPFRVAEPGYPNISYTEYRNNAGSAKFMASIPSPSALSEKADKSEVDALSRKTSGALTRTANLFDKDDPDYTESFFVDWNDGTLTPEGSTAYDASGYIEIEGGQSHYVSRMWHYALYDADKNYISGESTLNRVVAAPANAAYMRVSLRRPDADPETFYVVAGDQPLGTYIGFGGQVDPDRVFGLGETAYADNSVTARKVDFLEPTKNLFDKDAVTPDTFAGAIGTETSSETYSLSDYIEVEPGETYYGRGGVSAMRFYTAYDSDKNVVEEEGSNDSSYTLTVPSSGVKFYRITVPNEVIDVFQFEKGTEQTAFVPFGHRFTSSVNVVPNAERPSKWQGTKAVSYGDSVTFQEAWQPQVALALGLDHTALGVGGRQVGGASGMASQAGVDTIPTDTELLLVMGGVNDWAQSRALGTIDSTDIYEFYGALNLMAELITTRLPEARTFLLTPSYSEFKDGNWESRDGGTWISGAINGAGLTTRDYAEAVREVAKFWGIPIVDISAEEGVNTVNIDAYRKDDGNNIHPNGLSGDRIAQIVIGRLGMIEPLN